MSRNDFEGSELPEALSRLVLDAVAASGLKGGARDEFASDLRAHFEDGLAAGVDPDLLARRFGNPTAMGRAVARARAKQPVTEPHTGRSGMESVWRMVRHGARSLAKSPAFTIVGLLTIGLGVGTSTAIFSVVDAALLRPLPFHEPDRLAVIWGVAGPERDVRGASYPEVMDWRAMTRAFESISIVDQTTIDLIDRDEGVQLHAEIVSAGFFEMLGVEPARGRAFRPEDDRPGIEPVVVISHDLWQTRFGADPTVLGRTIRLSGGPVTVVGIMPEGFRGFSFETDIWATLPPTRPDMVETRNARWLAALGRLRAGTTFEQAQEDIAAVARELEARYPETNRERSADLFSLHEFFLGDTRDLLVMLFGAVLFLLLIACANITNLQLVRGLARGPEVSLRYALGANRRQLVQQLMTESLLLALAGGLLGLVIGYWSIQLLLWLLPEGVLAPYAAVELNARAFAFGLGLAVLAGILSGVVPALRSTASGISSALRGHARHAAASGRRFGFQHALVVAEIAVALPLLVGAGLMVRSLREQLAIPPGFHTEGVVVARLDLPPGQYAEEARMPFASALAGRLRSLPGIADVTIGSEAPLRGYSQARVLQREGYPDERVRYYSHIVFPGWFRALGIEVMRGREFEASDQGDGLPVAVVTQALAARFWPGEDALGKRLSLADNWVTVVGVVANVRYRDLTTSLMDPGEDPDVFLAFGQQSPTSFDIVVRTRRQVDAIAPLIQREVSALDSNLPIFDVRPLNAELAAQTARDRFGSSVLALFSGLALALAAVGLYGVMAFLVGARRREIAIRLAVGAQPWAAVAMVLRQGMGLVAIGGALGLMGALVAGRILESLLFGVSTLDPFTYTLVPLVVLGVAFAAALIPARRATRIDPQIALKGG